MNLEKLTMRSKLVGTFGLLATLVLVVSAFALHALDQADARFSGYVSGVAARAQLAQAIRAAVDDRAMAVRNLVLVTTPADTAIEKAAVEDAERRVEANLERFNAMVASESNLTDQGRSLAAEISRVETQYRPVALDINRLALDNQRDAAIAEIDVKCRPLLTALIKAVNDYLAYSNQRSADMIQQSQERFVSQRNLLIGLSLLAI
ncbi:MCP four helix bundle domain-containing protein, partial [Burkholderia glumae]